MSSRTIHFADGTQMTYLTGHIELSRGTGRWHQDPDGYWSQEMTPTRWFHEDGTLEREELGCSFIRVGCDADTIRRVGGIITHENPRPKPWWRFW